MTTSPFAGRWLADVGAEASKIEHLGDGDPLRKRGMSWDVETSLCLLIESRGKRSGGIELHDQEDQEIVRDLAAHSEALSTCLAGTLGP